MHDPAAVMTAVAAVSAFGALGCLGRAASATIEFAKLRPTPLRETIEHAFGPPDAALPPDLAALAATLDTID